jgi:hypothetical protein
LEKNVVEGGKGLVQEFRKIGGKPGHGFKVNLFAIPKRGGKSEQVFGYDFRLPPPASSIKPISL